MTAYRNAILISGQSEDVTAAMEAIRVLDQPLMRGRSTTRITPQYWSVAELATRLTELLTAEGYLVGTAARHLRPVLLIPVQTPTRCLCLPPIRNPGAYHRLGQRAGQAVGARRLFYFSGA